MPKKKMSDEQIAFALRQAESGMAVAEICWRLGVSEASFDRWKKAYAGMGVAEIRRLKQLEDENAKLKRLVADLTLDKTMLQDALQKSGEAHSSPRSRAAFSGGLRGISAAGLPCERVRAGVTALQVEA